MIVILFLESNIEAKEPVVVPLDSTVVRDSAVVVPIIIILSRISKI